VLGERYIVDNTVVHCGFISDVDHRTAGEVRSDVLVYGTNGKTKLAADDSCSVRSRFERLKGSRLVCSHYRM
jgi:hypothetical protein